MLSVPKIILSSEEYSYRTLYNNANVILEEPPIGPSKITFALHSLFKTKKGFILRLPKKFKNFNTWTVKVLFGCETQNIYQNSYEQIIEVIPKEQFKNYCIIVELEDDIIYNNKLYKKNDIITLILFNDPKDITNIVNIAPEKYNKTYCGIKEKSLLLLFLLENLQSINKLNCSDSLVYFYHFKIANGLGNLYKPMNVNYFTYDKESDKTSTISIEDKTTNSTNQVKLCPIINDSILIESLSKTGNRIILNDLKSLVIKTKINMPFRIEKNLRIDIKSHHKSNDFYFTEFVFKKPLRQIILNQSSIDFEWKVTLE